VSFREQTVAADRGPLGYLPRISYPEQRPYASWAKYGNRCLPL